MAFQRLVRCRPGATINLVVGNRRMVAPSASPVMEMLARARLYRPSRVLTTAAFRPSTTLLRRQSYGHNDEVVPDSPPPTDFGRMDVLADTPPPATSIDACFPDGFLLGGGVRITGGSGALVVGGEAFSWRPWETPGTSGKRLINAKGQWEVPDLAFGLLGMTWPRPGECASQHGISDLAC
jgi:hypothetical protein